MIEYDNNNPLIKALTRAGLEVSFGQNNDIKITPSNIRLDEIKITLPRQVINTLGKQETVALPPVVHGTIDDRIIEIQVKTITIMEEEI